MEEGRCGQKRWMREGINLLRDNKQIAEFICAAECTTVHIIIVLLVCVSLSPGRLGGVCSVIVNIDICDTAVRSSTLLSYLTV